MNRHHSGRGTGLALVVILIVALVVAWLAVTQLRSLSGPRDAATAREATLAQPTADPVQQARDAVDALNERMQAAAEP
jgi:Tfp pilus assembly protein PilX